MQRGGGQGREREWPCRGGGGVLIPQVLISAV